MIKNLIKLSDFLDDIHYDWTEAISEPVDTL